MNTLYKVEITHLKKEVNIINENILILHTHLHDKRGIRVEISNLLKGQRTCKKEKCTEEINMFADLTPEELKRYKGLNYDPNLR